MKDETGQRETMPDCPVALEQPENRESMAIIAVSTLLVAAALAVFLAATFIL